GLESHDVVCCGHTARELPALHVARLREPACHLRAFEGAPLAKDASYLQALRVSRERHDARGLETRDVARSVEHAGDESALAVVHQGGCAGRLETHERALAKLVHAGDGRAGDVAT